MNKGSNNVAPTEKDEILSLLRRVASAETEDEYFARVAVLRSSKLLVGEPKRLLRQFIEKQWLAIPKVIFAIMPFYPYFCTML